MMIICAVYDRQLDAYMQPFTAQSKGQATRSFRDEVNRKDSELNRHPEDYTLNIIGEYDEHSGTIEPCKPTQLAIASNLIEQPQPRLTDYTSRN